MRLVCYLLLMLPYKSPPPKKKIAMSNRYKCVLPTIQPKIEIDKITDLTDGVCGYFPLACSVKPPAALQGEFLLDSNPKH